MEGEDVMNSTFFKAMQTSHRDLLQRAAREGLYVCVPQSCSLDLAPLTRAAFLHHTLRGVEGAVGQFLTLSERSVLVRDMTAATGEGFAARVEARVLETRTLTVTLPEGEAAGRLHLYFLSRPLEGGLAAPASVDELTPAALAALLGYLHMRPEAEAPLARFDAQVAALVEELRGEGAEAEEAVGQWLARADVPRDGSEGGGGGWEEEGGGEGGGEEGGGERYRDWSACNLALQLQSHVAEAAEELMAACGEALAQVAGGGGGGGGAAQESLWRRLLLSLQGDACRRLHAPLMRHLRRELAPERARLEAALGAAAALPPDACAAALGIAPRYRVAQGEAARVLGGLRAAACPLTKLQVLLAARGAIVGAIEADLLRRGVSLADVALGMDELLPLMAHVLAQCLGGSGGAEPREAVADFPAHLGFVQLCHHPLAGSLSQSQLGYTLANWDSAQRGTM